jgi:integrase
MKSRTGYVFKNEKSGKWFARVTYTERSGKRKNIQRTVENKSKGDELLKELIHKLDKEGASSIGNEKLSFNDLADHYTKHYLKEAQYVNGRKVSGLRSVVSVRGYVKILRDYFGKQKLRTITYEDLLTFRNGRLNTSTHQSKQRSITTVNREMAYLRRLLNIAERNGWVNKNPFKRGDALIHVVDETKRERILTREEETILLNCCTGFRAHLRPIIIAALDLGCRLGELLKMRWKDIDFDAGLITIQAFNTKTMRQREVSLTIRLKNELEKLLNKSQKNSDELVFGISCVIRQSFNNACAEAGLEGLRFHDLRHSHATRLDDLGFSLAKIGMQLGHTQLQTTLRYVNRDKSSIKQVANALDAFNNERVIEETAEMVN